MEGSRPLDKFKEWFEKCPCPPERSNRPLSMAALGEKQVKFEIVPSCDWIDPLEDFRCRSPFIEVRFDKINGVEESSCKESTIVAENAETPVSQAECHGCHVVMHVSFLLRSLITCLRQLKPLGLRLSGSYTSEIDSV